MGRRSVARCLLGRAPCCAVSSRASRPCRQTVGKPCFAATAARGRLGAAAPRGTVDEHQIRSNSWRVVAPGLVEIVVFAMNTANRAFRARPRPKVESVEIYPTEQGKICVYQDWGCGADGIQEIYLEPIQIDLVIDLLRRAKAELGFGEMPTAATSPASDAANALLASVTRPSGPGGAPMLRAAAPGEVASRSAQTAVAPSELPARPVARRRRPTARPAVAAVVAINHQESGVACAV